MKRRTTLLVVVLLVTLALVGCQAMAADGNLTLDDLLLYLTTGPGIGVAIAVILEKVPFAKRYFDMIQDLEWKRMTVLALCVFFALGAQVLRAYLGYVVLDENTVFNALAAAWEAFTAGTVLHGFIREKQA